MRVFLDANILFSAVKSGGAIRQLLLLLKENGHTAVADVYVESEARRNLEVKFPNSLRDFENVLGDVEKPTTASHPLPATLAPELPEKDRPVLAAAIEHRCQVLLTGDKAHFGLLYGKEIHGVTIHSPASLAKQLLSL